MHLVSVVFVLTFLSATYGQSCSSCPTTYQTCISAAGINPVATCNCLSAYSSCIQNSASDPTCAAFATVFSTVCAASSLICPSISCNTSIVISPCLQCQTNYGLCVAANPSSPCTCITPMVQCLSKNNCAGSDILCGSYSALCPSLQCSGGAGCGSCVTSFTRCVNSNPIAACNCLAPYSGCISNCTGVSVGPAIISDYDITCPIYQAQCPSIPCNSSASLTGCPKCAQTAAVCVSQSLASGTGGVCNCLASAYSCLSGSTCGLTPYNALCSVYSGICPNINCGSSSPSKLATQVVAILTSYQNAVVNYLQNILQGNITFGNYTAVGNSQVIDVVVEIPSSVSVDVYFQNFKIQFALYFNISSSLVSVTYNQAKRSAQQSAQVTVQSPSGSAPSSGLPTGAIVGIVAAVILVIVAVVLGLGVCCKQEQTNDSTYNSM